MSSGSHRKGLLPISRDNSSKDNASDPINPSPLVQRRSSQPLPGISATASSLRSRRAGSASAGSAASKSNQHLNYIDDNDFDDETPGDFDPGMQPSSTNRSGRGNLPANLLRAALVPGSSQNQPPKAVSNPPINAPRKQGSTTPLSPPPVPSNRFKGTPARTTRYSLPVRAEKPVRTTKTSGKHVVLPSESQLAPLPGEDDDEDDEDDDDEEGSEEEEAEEEEEEEEEEVLDDEAEAADQSGTAPAKAGPSAQDGKQDAVLLGGRGVGAVAGTKPPAKVPVTTPRPGPTIPSNRHTAPAPVPGKLFTPASKGSQRPAASSALARAAISSVSAAQARHAQKAKPKAATTFRNAATRAPPLRPHKSGPVYHNFERMPPSARLMTPLPRLTAYSISTSIHLGTLLGFLRREHGVKPRLYDECAYAVYTKPLLPGFGRANVRSAPEPRSASPNAESRRERELEQREEFGYLGTYFEQRQEEEEDIDQDGYIKGGEGRGSDSESRRRGDGHRGDGGGGGETSAWESEAERWTASERRNSRGREQGDDAEATANAAHQHARNQSTDSATVPISSSLDEDEEMLATPLARPTAVTRNLSGSDSEAGVERRPFLLERRRGSQSSVSDVEALPPYRCGSPVDVATDKNELAINTSDSAGARDMMLQQRAEERGETEPMAHSYRSNEMSMTSDLDEIANTSREENRDSEVARLVAPEVLTTLDENAIPGDDVKPSLAKIHNGNEKQSETQPDPERRTRKVKLRRRKRRYAGPNMASHNHDTSANLNTPRPILEALQSAELVILPYGVLVMYNFSAAEERSIIEDVLSSGCAREPMDEAARETEAFHFCYDPNISAPRIFNDFFTFRAPNHLLKLSLAHAIAQSTKLSVFEERMQATLELTSHIPKEMASSGELKLKRREALRLTGRLFKLRVDVNLTSNVLDTPELFWSEASLKALYDAIRDYLEIDERVENLNERLAVANDLLEIIHEHIANTAMSKITWIVIILIIVACAVAVGEISARFIVGANRTAGDEGFKPFAALRSAPSFQSTFVPQASRYFAIDGVNSL
ncbi:related to RMD8 - Cytosolic protein required for sporulation [Melanopsichium pennsylvanicum]|uniref:Related to RMD8 - Cytosolic protein required for sporulation n=1 Tax=Melanopsichium pennsylvanicum TaxID=63383 RepID=A0AAJ5C4G8_9BASI|nr:related to RMD8 - Cytosolic protein required for sporulation [Melanopsichium pennsylvanicum]